MPQGDKSAYTDKQKRQARHIEDSYESGGVVYGSSRGDVGYIGVVPHGAAPNHGELDWAGPVMPDERVRGPRRLSTEERLRLRSDIRDASRSMYEHPRVR